MNHPMGEPNEIHMTPQVCYHFLCTLLLAYPEPVKTIISVLQEEYIHSTIATKVKRDDLVWSELIQKYWDNFNLFMNL